MRAFAFLLMLSFAGYVSTQYAFQTGKQYTYQVRGRLMTGISKINTQYAGLEVDYKVDLIAVGPNTIVLKPHGFRATEVNAELDGGWKDGELNEEAPVDIKGELREFLESPIELTMRQGVVDSIKVEGNLPTWAVNIKKAQASHFVLDTTGANVVLSGNLNRKTNSVRPEEANQESGFFYETMEDTVHGECETYYTVSQNGPFDSPFPFQQQQQAGQQQQNDEENSAENGQQNSSSQEQDSQERNNKQNQAMDNTYNKDYKYGNNQWHKEQNDQQSNEQQQRQQYFGNQQEQQEYQANNAYHQYAAYKQYAQQADSGSAEDSYETRQGEIPWPQAFDKFCNSNDQIYEILKSVNFTSCKNKPVLSYSTSAQIYGRAGDNSLGSAFERAVITRFLACGKDRKQYTILQIKQEEQVNFGLRLNQKTVAGTVQNLTLLSITKADNLVKLQNPKTIQDLSYTFDPLEQKLQKRGEIAHAYPEEHEDNDSQEAQNQQNQQSNEGQSQESQEQRQQQQQQQRSQKSKSRRPRSASSQENSSEEQDDQNDEQKNQQNQQNEYYQTSAEGKGQLPQPSLTEAPLNPFLVSPLRTSGMKKRIQDLMKEIVQDITTDKQSLAEAETLSKISKVAQILRFLSYRDIEQLYYQVADKRQTEEDQTSRFVFLDAVAIAGTNPAIKVLSDLIQKKQLTGEHAAQIIMTFPMYVRTPTQALLREIYELADSSAVESDKDQVKTAAVLALSNLLYQACVNSRIRNSKYPVATYGQFCDQKTVQRKYAHYFVDNLKKHQQSQEQEDNHWAATYLTALGNLGVPEVIPEVQRIIDDEVESYVKVKAIFALKHLIVSRQNQNIPTEQFQPVDRQSQDELTDELIENEVLPILVAVSADKGEHPEVRMAALSLLFFATDADMTIWQQVAYSTWFAGSTEVHAFIYSTLKSLAALERPNSPLHYKMQQKARAVLSLAKPTNAGYAKSRNIFSSQFFEHVQSGYYHHLEYFGAKDSNIPAYMFYKNNVQFGNGGYGTNPLEVEVHGDTIQKLVSYVYQQFRKETSADEQHPENEQVERLVGIQDREQDENNEASFRFKIRSEMERLFSINEQTIQQLIQKAKGQLLPQLLNGLPINYQKTFHMMEQTMEMPSAMGIPITHRFTMAVHFSARGNLKIVNENGLKDVQLQAEIHPVYAWKGHGKLSIKSPYTGKKYEAGVQRHMVVEAPFRALVRKAQQGQIVVAFTPSQLTKGNPSGQIDIVTYHQRPYTAIINDECWPTSHKEGGQQKIVHAVQMPYKNERSFGQKALGMHFTIKEQTDYRSQNEGPSGWVKFWKQFHSPTCYFNVGWFGAEQVRHAERTLSLDVSKSETKTLAFVAGGKYEQKAEYNELWNDSKSGSSESSEESSQQSSSRQRDSQEKQNKQQTRGQRRNQENDNSNEDPSQEGQVIAVALIGKRAPIKAPQESRGIQKVLQKSNPSTVQYLLQASQSSGRVYFRAASGDSANEAANDLPQTSESLKALRDAVMEPQNAKTQEDGCVEFEGEYEAPKHANSQQLVVLRKTLLQEDLSVKVKGEAQFGKSCKNMQHEIKLQGKLTRGPKMTEWAQKKSPEAKKCEKDEQQGFSVSPVCLYVADQQAAALNHAELKITYSKDLPVQLRNSTNGVEDFAKAYLYPYMSNDRYHEGTQEREIHVEAHMTPSKEFIDVTITKPNSRLSFRSIRTNGLVKALLPLTATQSLAKNVQDRTIRGDSQPFCSVQGNQVNTFDNVTYRFDKDVSSGCYQVLAKDCSGRQPVAVLVKDMTEQKKEVILLLGDQTKIHLAQKSQQQNNRLYGKAKLQVKVNDQRAENFPHVIRSKDGNQLIAQIEIMNEGIIQVSSPQFQVATNGDWIYVQAAHSLRNRTCGICGDFDGEKVGEFRGPKDCALSSGSLLVASYSYQSTDPQDKEQCKVQSQAKKQIAHEQSQCQRSAAYYPNQPRMFPNQYQQQGNNQYDVQYNSQQQNQQVQASNECIEKVKEKVRVVVYDVANNVLKPFVWNSSKRHGYANKVADYVANKVAEILANNSTAQAIAQAVVKVACAGLKLIPIAGRFIGLACSAASPLLQKAVLLAVNPICQKTGCCTPSQSSFNAAEIADQLAFAFADEAEADPSDVSYIPKRNMPMPCLQMLEENLSQTFSKFAYLLLIKDKDMSENERRRITRQVSQDVREAVQQSMKSGGNGRLIQSIQQALDKINGLQKVRKTLYSFIERLSPFVVRLFNILGCDFPIPRTQNSSNNQNNNNNSNQSNSDESQEQNNQSNNQSNENDNRQSSSYNRRQHHHHQHQHRQHQSNNQ